MELLGRKLITPEAEVDEDSLSIDSFPELPSARRIGKLLTFDLHCSHFLY
jgi:hypothetical protein